MQDRIVANDAQIPYPEHTGDPTMTRKGLPVENPGPHEGEAKIQRTGAEGVHRHGEGDLAREKREVEESSERTREAAKRAVEVLREAPVKKAKEPVETPAKKTKEPQIVSTYPHLFSSSREKVVEALSGQSVSLDVPKEWEKWGYLTRKKWLRENKVMNTTGPDEFPQIAGGATRWTNEDIARMDAGDTLRNLGSLVNEETRDPAGFAARGGVADRLELHDHLRGVLRQDGRVGSVVQRLMDYAARGVVNPEQQALRNDLDYLIDSVRQDGVNRQNYHFVHNFVIEMDALENLNRGVPARLRQLDSALDPTVRTELRDVNRNLYEHFRNIDQGLSDEDRRNLYSEVNTEAVNARNYAIQFGGQSFREIERRIFGAVAQEQQRVSPEHAELLEWHATDALERIKQYIEQHQELGIPVRWEDALRNVENNLRFIESTDFPQEDLSAVRQRLVQISEFVSQSAKTENDAARKVEIENMRNQVNEIKDSVLALYDLRVALEAANMNPEEVVRHFQTNVWKDNTFKVYFERFLKDHLQRDTKDGSGNNVNFLDKAMQVYFKKLAEERKQMNAIEQLTLMDIFHSLTGRDYALIEERMGARNQHGRLIPKRLTGAERRELEDVRVDLARRIGELDTINHDTRSWGILMPRTKLAISEWYRENTLLGAHGVDGSNKKYLDIQRSKLEDDLKGVLGGLGGEVAGRVGEYEQSGLLRQVINNAHTMGSIFGAYSDHDGIRVYRRQKSMTDLEMPMFDNRPILGGFVYNSYSDVWSGRMVDHFTEFIQDENRGRPGHDDRYTDANQVVTKHMLGKRRGILGQNRLLVKLVADKLSDLGDMERIRDKLVVSGRNFDLLLAEKMLSLDNIDKLDPGEFDPATGAWSEGLEYDRDWAKGAAIEELIDDGDISFEKIEWSKVFANERTNIIKYNMGDWWGDRASAFKYLGAEQLQEYLQAPNTKKFFDINSIQIFYSKREKRIKPWTKLIMPAHFELGEHWKEWWKLPYKMAHAEKEEMVEYATQSNRLDVMDHEFMKIKHLGWGPLPGITAVRRVRQMAEFVGILGIETAKRWYVILAILLGDLVKQSFEQSQAQLAGK